MKYAFPLVGWICLPTLLDSSSTKRKDISESLESITTTGNEVTDSKNQSSTTFSQLKIDLDHNCTQSKYKFHLLYLIYGSCIGIV